MPEEMKASTNFRSYHKVLTIAGSDSGGGAGIQADLKTFGALGCYGMSVVTALTAQNTKGVTAIHAVPAEFAAQQMEAVFTDIGTDAVKIGMLYSAELIRTVASQLKKHAAGNIVLDPVMIAQSGDKLLQEEAIDALRTQLFPLAEIVTPNLPEAEVLLGRKLKNQADMQAGARSLSEAGCRAVMIKGGHLIGNDSSDVLYLAETNRSILLEGKRVETINNHGTGCTLSSAIAAFLAKGDDLALAVRNAKDFVSQAIYFGARYRIGHGKGPVHHFFDVWD